MQACVCTYMRVGTHPPPCTWVDGVIVHYLSAAWLWEPLACPELIAKQPSGPHTHCGDSSLPERGGATLLSGAPVCARQQGPCQGIDYATLEAAGVLSGWARLEGLGSRKDSWHLQVQRTWL